VPKLSSCVFGNEAESTKIVALMAAGVPVVVAKTRIDAFYPSRETVEFFEPENEVDLADCLRLLANDQKRRSELASNGIQYFLRNNWETVKPDYLSIVDHLGRTMRAERQPTEQNAGCTHSRRV
jgi:glycosyltransferase involved in cell wall biosynthesis